MSLYRIHNYTMELDDSKIDSIAHLKAPLRSAASSAFRVYPERLYLFGERQFPV